LEEEEKKKADEIEAVKQNEEEWMLYKTPSQNLIACPLEDDEEREAICTCNYSSEVDRGVLFDTSWSPLLNVHAFHCSSERMLSLPTVLYTSPGLAITAPPSAGSAVVLPPHIIQTAPTPQHSPLPFKLHRGAQVGIQQPHQLALTLPLPLSGGLSPAPSSEMLTADGPESNSSVSASLILTKLPLLRASFEEPLLADQPEPACERVSVGQPGALDCCRSPPGSTGHWRRTAETAGGRK